MIRKMLLAALCLGLVAPIALEAAPASVEGAAWQVAAAKAEVQGAKVAKGAKVVKKRKVGTSVVALMTKSGKIVSGDNEVIVAITDTKGNPKSAKVKGLTIYMPPMGSMAAMKAEADLQPARTPGVYTGTLEVEMKGPWKATVTFEDEKGPHRAALNIVAR